LPSAKPPDAIEVWGQQVPGPIFWRKLAQMCRWALHENGLTFFIERIHQAKLLIIAEKTSRTMVVGQQFQLTHSEHLSKHGEEPKHSCCNAAGGGEDTHSSTDTW
jgi:hypothetical protein